MSWSIIEAARTAVRRSRPSRPQSRQAPTKILDRFFLHALLTGALLLLVLPIFIAAVASTKDSALMTGLGDLLPGRYAGRNYYIALVRFGFWRFLLNSLVMSVAIVAGQLALALVAALAIVYYRLPYENAIFLFILMTLLLPVPVRFVPLYELIVQLGWRNTLFAITIPYMGSAVAVFLLRQHFLTIPPSLVEHAQIDGVGPRKFLTAILIPMSRGVLAAVSVIIFVYAWNQYLWPAIVIDTERNQVAQVGLNQLGGGPIAMAGAILTLLPPLVVLVVFHRTLLSTIDTQLSGRQ
jgi:sn-glycerol 3-phosphate transport system permease protein